MKYRLLLLLSLISFSASIAQSKVKVIQEFVPGEKYNFEVKRGKEDSRDQSTKGLFVITPMTANVMTSKDNFRTIALKYGESTLVGREVSLEVQEKYRNEELYTGIEIALIIDHEGKFHGLADFDGVKKQLENAMAKLYEIKGATIDESTFNQIKDLLSDTYDTEEELIATYFPEISIYFNQFGNDYKFQKKQHLRYDSPNPFDGPPFPMMGTSEFSEFDDPIAIIKGSDSIKPEDLRRILISTFKPIAEAAGQSFNELEIPEFDMIVTSECVYNTKTKKLISVTMNKRIKMSDVEQNVFIGLRMVN